MSKKLGTAIVKILKPISREIVKEKSVEDLMDIVRSDMEKGMNEPQACADNLNMKKTSIFSSVYLGMVWCQIFIQCYVVLLCVHWFCRLFF